MIKNILILSLFLCAEVHAQKTEKITGTFRSTRVINAHSTEILKKGKMDFRIMHRFGVVNSGVKQFFGLDNAVMRLGFDFGISDNLMVGVGRSTINKDLDVFLKGRILQQSSNDKIMPISLLAAGGYIVRTDESFATIKPNFVDRSSYYLQMIIGRKFTKDFSMQLSPIYLHNNSTLNPTDDNNVFGLGGGLRYQVSKRIGLMMDYHYITAELGNTIKNPLSLGVDIGTGGHVFQLHFSNSSGLNEKGYLSQTTGNFFKGDIRFGFNLSRVFNIAHKN